MGNESSVFRELVEAHIHVEMDFYESGKQKLKEKEVQQSVEDRKSKSSLLRDIDDCAGDAVRAYAHLRTHAVQEILPLIFQHFSGGAQSMTMAQFTSLVRAELEALRSAGVDVLHQYLDRKYHEEKYLHRMRGSQVRVTLELLQTRVLPHMQRNASHFADTMWHAMVGARNGAATDATGRSDPLSLVQALMTRDEFLQQYLDQSHKLVKQALRYFKTYQPTFCELNEPASLGLVF